MTLKRMKTATSLPRNILYISTYHKHCLNTKMSWKPNILLFLKAFCHNRCSQKTKCTSQCSLPCSESLTMRNYYISRKTMSDFFKSRAEPMDIEGEAECAAVIQGVTARGEQGPAVDENVGLGNQSDSPLLSDEGEPTDGQEQVIADAGDSVRRAVAWTLLDVDYPEDETRGSIPAGLPFSTWVREFRNSCGYNSVETVGVAKRSSSTNAGQRPAKQRR